MRFYNFINKIRLYDISLLTLITSAVLFLPFLYSSSTIDPVLLPRFLALSILSLVLVIIISMQVYKNKGKKYDYIIIHRAIFGVISAYLILSAVSMTQAINLTESVFEWLKLFIFFAFFYVASLILVRNNEGIAILTKSFIIAGLMLALIGICQYFRVAFMNIPGNFTVYATMGHKNLFASALFLTLPFALYGSIRFAGYWRIVSCISTGFICYGILISKTRSVWLAIVLSAIVALIVFSYRVLYQDRDFRFRRRLSVFCFISVAILFLALSQVDLISKISRPILSDYQLNHSKIPSTEIALSSSASLKERFVLWEKSIKMITESPIIGVGPGQWKLKFPYSGEIEKLRQIDTNQVEVHPQRPHNDYLWVLSETGILGLICYLSFFLIIYFYILKIIFNSHTRDHQIFAILMLFGITGYMVLSFFSFPKERIVHNIFLMLTAAAVLSIYHDSFPIQKKISFNKIKCLNISIMLLSGICIVFGYARLSSEFHAKEAISAHRLKHWERVISEIDRTYTWAYNVDPAATPLAWYRGVANVSLNNIPEALHDFTMAYKIHPNHIHVLNNLGTCYVLLKDNHTAVKYYKKALAIFPEFKDCRRNLNYAIGRMINSL